MSFNATSFINNRPNRTSITSNRIKAILWYFEECNRLQSDEGVKYSISWVRENTKINFEDYLKFEFIDNYLTRNKHLLKDRISELENINFVAETQKRYIDTTDNNLQKVDKIDIFISRLGVQNEWSDVDENIYFSVECKRIKKLSDTSDYVSDIAKFTTRQHTNLRLPFEGQLAFVENISLSNSSITKKINSHLEEHQVINTEKYLSYTNIHSSDNIYHSTHRKSFGKNELFSVYHLLFDYTKIVLE